MPEAVSLSNIVRLTGGIGLFLLGMQLMTEGLKLSAGKALRALLERWTGTAMRGLLSGAVITSLVQSSSAVTFATIGFVNAGIMSLSQAVTVIYGSNVGTTTTGWLVALIGLHFDVEAFALPAVGVGMLLRLVWGERRLGALGEAIAGLGVFFLGIEVLKTTFGGIGGAIQVESLIDKGFPTILLFAGLGFIFTLLTQSSSAAIAITLTSAAGGVLPLGVAAAMIIGANVGTTSTAALAVLGATPNARRVAAAHVVFNVVTGAVALLLLPLLLHGLTDIRIAVHFDQDPAVVLAFFHTTFNLLGVVLLWPVTPALVRFLGRRFRSAEEDESRPQFLDKNVVNTPSLAMDALVQELGRIGAIAGRLARGALSRELSPEAQIRGERHSLDRLVDAVGEFTGKMRSRNLPDEMAERLPNALRVARHYSEVAELAETVAKGLSHVGPVRDDRLAEDLAGFKGAVVRLLDRGDDRTAAPADEAVLVELDEKYEELKSAFLQAGGHGEIAVRPLVEHLDVLSDIRRMAREACHAAFYLRVLATAGASTAPLMESEGKADALAREIR